MVPDHSNMCRESLLAFAGHSFINAFTLADAWVQVGFLTGKISHYTHAVMKGMT